MKAVFASCIFFYVAVIAAAVVVHDAYSVQYNEKNHCPDYVVYSLRDMDILANHPRYSFIKDPLIKATVSTFCYCFSGYERGHMCPGEDKGAETYYTSNICPQNPVLNKGLWKELENQIRKEALYARLVIICGPIFHDSNEKWIKSTIRIPDAFFKIVFNLETGNVRAYVMENKPLSGRNPADYLTTVPVIEKLTGLNLEQIKQERQDADIHNLHRGK